MSQDPPGYPPPPPPPTGPAPIVGQPAQPPAAQPAQPYAQPAQPYPAAPPAQPYPAAPPAQPYPAAPPAQPYPAPPAQPYAAQPAQPYADPYAAERALADWATQRGMTLNGTPDVRWYQAWAPFVYLFSISRVGRELRGRVDDADVALVEAFDPDPIKQAASEDRQLVCFLISQRLRARAALRAKSGGGIVSDVASGLGSLLRGSSAGSVLGDPTLESRFDVTVPSREEGNLALPTTLRQMLVSHQWRGILELRPGGMACAIYDRKTFDPVGLDATLGTLAQIYRCAIT